MKTFLFLLCSALSFIHGSNNCQKEANITFLQQDPPSVSAERYLLSIDCSECAIDKITNKDHLTSFTITICDSLGIKRHRKPILEHIDDGYYLIQLGHIDFLTGNFIDQSGNAYLDIHSSRYFNPDLVAKIIQDYLQPKSIKLRFVVRDKNPNG
jgi:hypothetical protein